MQIALIAVLLAGCNQIYGLDATHIPPDARQECTDQAPMFHGSPVLVAPGPQLTRSYSMSMDRRIAVGNQGGGLVEGPGDVPLTNSALLMPPPPNMPMSPRLSPEGDELFLRTTTNNTSTVYRYARENNLWVQKASLFSFPVAIVDLSPPTRRDLGPRHMIVYDSKDLREYVESSLDQWTQVGTYVTTDLATMSFEAPQLTPDGLHLIFRGSVPGNFTLTYASRSAIDGRFENPVDANMFFGHPNLFDPFLTEDCGRLYVLVSQIPVGIYYIDAN